MTDGATSKQGQEYKSLFVNFLQPTKKGFKCSMYIVTVWSLFFLTSTIVHYFTTMEGKFEWIVTTTNSDQIQECVSH